MTQVRDVGDPVGLPVDQRFPESSRDRGQGERVGFLVVTEWSYRDLRSQGLRTRLAQRGPDKLLAAGKTLSLCLSPFLRAPPFFKGVTHVAATCSPLDWPRQDLHTIYTGYIPSTLSRLSEWKSGRGRSFEEVSKEKFWITEMRLWIFFELSTLSNFISQFWNSFDCRLRLSKG